MLDVFFFFPYFLLLSFISVFFSFLVVSFFVVVVTFANTHVAQC